jgi:alkyldihydroxyacetonephosphate synthase
VPTGRDLAAGEYERIVPGPPPARDLESESLDVWGFRDTAFVVRPNGAVVLTGERYELAGPELPDLLPWTQSTLEVEIDPTDVHVSAYPPEIPEPRLQRDFVEEIRGRLSADAISTDARQRMRHGHGHTQDEMYRVKYGRLVRVPDLVVHPGSEEEVVALVEAAVRHDVCLVPYGGGTNVTEALRCRENEERSIVSVDMGRMNRILWIDPTNLTACIEAGAVGRLVNEQLAEHGFTLGHEPDSIEFSTLGGWIATFASGMKKNRYGNIEDLVLDTTVVTARGLLSRESEVPRESVGADVRRWIFGSEGNLGIVTKAIVKIFPLPEVERHDAILFRCFEDGVAFMYDLTRSGQVPASVRLVDNLQFQLSQTLKPKATGLGALKSRLQRLYVTRLRGFATEEMVACTIVFEGAAEEVKAQQAVVGRLAKRHGGLRAGAENGKRGYALTFGIAYIRDFVMKHWVLAESFETSVPWNRVLALCENVKRRIREEHRKRGLPGKPFVTCRVTQVYPSGVAVYFYFAFHHKGVEHPSEVYAELERCARDEILLSGGSLSHHHGVDKPREGFLPRVFPPAALEWNAEVKRAIDPGNVFGSGNQAIS